MVLAGSEIDDLDFVVIEDNGAMVVADRHCFGSFRVGKRSKSGKGKIC